MFGQKKSKNKKAPPAQQAQKPRSNGNSHTDAIVRMKNTSHKLELRRNFLSTKAENARKQAIKYKKQGKSGKRMALMHLKSYKQLEGEVLKIDNLLYNVNEQLLNLESQAVSVDAVGAMRTGMKAQKNLLKKLDPDDLVETLDENADLLDRKQEIDDIFAQDAGFDELDLMNELDELDMEDEDVTVSQRADDVVLDLPSPVRGDIAALPNTPAGVSEDDEEALRQLEAELL